VSIGDEGKEWEDSSRREKSSGLSCLSSLQNLSLPLEGRKNKIDLRVTAIGKKKITREK
jgi:hypothetical protein